MALFTDGSVSGMEDLTAQDTQLANVANVEGIDVTQKLLLAQEELALELAAILEGWRSADQAFWLAAQPNIGNVVVTPSLKLWHTYRTLEMVYRDAYSNQLNDRYAAKRDQFRERAKWAYEKLGQIGIGMAYSPLPQATMPAVVCTPGNLPDGTYYVAMAWTNNAGEEGAPSVPRTIEAAGSTVLVQPATPPARAASWNVYLGTAPDAMSMQNETSIPIAQTWLQPNAMRTDRPAPGSGQSPSYMRPMPHRILRG